MSPLKFNVPRPPTGVVTIPSSDTAAAAAKFYGEDIWLDVTQGAAADYVVTAAGDWRTVTGLEALRQSVIRRIITNPGEWPTLPDYGVGARQYVKAKNTPAIRAELAQRIRSQLSRDPRIERIDDVAIEQLAEGNGLRISVFITPRGRLRTDTPVRITIGIRS